mmetsp:Transcript_15695/g.31995  ORF Transcript_15695/g.31995 Transcript_15695/m.31995 type:complete len:216 (-) Transcript_15695:198-845(-)
MATNPCIRRHPRRTVDVHSSPSSTASSSSSPFRIVASIILHLQVVAPIRFSLPIISISVSVEITFDVAPSIPISAPAISFQFSPSVKIKGSISIQNLAPDKTHRNISSFTITTASAAPPTSPSAPAAPQVPLPGDSPIFFSGHESQSSAKISGHSSAGLPSREIANATMVVIVISSATISPSQVTVPVTSEVSVGIPKVAWSGDIARRGSITSSE